MVPLLPHSLVLTQFKNHHVVLTFQCALLRCDNDNPMSKETSKSKEMNESNEDSHSPD